MTDQSVQFPRFFVTAPSRCPYLPGRQERKVFTELRGEDATALNEALSRVGFRRSQSVAYRPACEGCSACISVRVVAREFVPTRSMRRIAARNAHIVASVIDPFATREQYGVLKRYLADRHADGGMSSMDFYDYADMVENTTVTTRIIEYRLPHEGTRHGRLVAACLTDFMSDGLSMVYSFFDPEFRRLSPGTWIIMHHLEEARRRDLHHVYLGYWVRGSPKMNYKSRFRPLERLGPNGWSRAPGD